MKEENAALIVEGINLAYDFNENLQFQTFGSMCAPSSSIKIYYSKKKYPPTYKANPA